jgi:hypothetical protein
LFTEAADKLICSDISDFIQTDSQQLGLKISWHIPAVVKAERKYQMLERGKKLLPSLAKVESLLGHALGINEEVLDSRVDDAIKRQMDQHQLSELGLATDKVDWSQIISLAVRKLPPFEPGEKEKGFRDALILEAFSQLADSAPKSSASARIILLSSDKLLQSATRERFKDRSNVLVADSLDEIRTILNAVASQLTQEAISSILPKAAKMFFDRAENKETLYYKSAVSKEIQSLFQGQFDKPPAPDFVVTTKKIMIGNPTFLTKAKQRLSLSSKITYGVEATKQILRTLPSASSPPGLLSAIGNPQSPAIPTGMLNFGTTLLGSGSHEYFEEIKQTGSSIFEAFWSVTLNRRGSLANPHLDKIEFRSTSWDN